ncbi:NADH-quinone oxidoreductase subunit C [Nakamurella sp. UYEF19]|uniref:NADH-quinone oxidoreductase subunit C n=1 Tax=Nakamurella sp. UYEF19 TaxID=1756392 RepID=UPI0033938F8E
MTAPDGAANPPKQPGNLAPGAASSVDSPATPASGGTTDASHQSPAPGTDLATAALHDPTPALAPVGVERTGMFGVNGSGDTSGFGLLVSAPYAPAPAERPYGGPGGVLGARDERSSGSDQGRGVFDQVADALAAAMVERNIPATALLQTTVANSEITFYLAREHLSAMFWALRDDPALRFELASSISGVDYGPAVPRRLHVVYELTSMTYRRRIRLEVAVGIDDPHVPSAVATYPTADWHERETWDMFGIIFDGHPGLTRILMPDDWDGHPQRKDYPLGGIPVEYKGAEIPAPDQRRSYS